MFKSKNACQFVVPFKLIVYATLPVKAKYSAYCRLNKCAVSFIKETLLVDNFII